MIGAKKTQVDHSKDLTHHVMSSSSVKDLSENASAVDPCGPPVTCPRSELSEYDDELFLHPEKVSEQTLIDAILDSTIYEEQVRERLRNDPLVRLLIPNPPGKYDFTIVSAMGVVTEGKKGLELIGAYDRLEEQRGVKVIRSDTATARSLEYNSSKIEEAIEIAVEMGKPYGYIGYSQGKVNRTGCASYSGAQEITKFALNYHSSFVLCICFVYRALGCANALLTETLLLSGSPKQQKALKGLVCRQLLFSAANGSFHGLAMDKKVRAA